MSLFENDRYQWRETFFVLFEERNRPSLTVVRNLLKQLGKSFELDSVRESESDQFESLSVLFHEDFSAMDLTYVTGEDIEAQREELKDMFDVGDLLPDEEEKLDYLPKCDVRYDVYHFEQVMSADEGEGEDELLDPGGLLLLLGHLAERCKGVAIDPQSGTFV